MMTLEYPTPPQVEKADVIQLARWTRFLPSPGANSIGTHEFTRDLGIEMATLDLIMGRFNELGGMTPEISKQIGWK